MKRTTVSLPDELARALEREAHRRAVPVSAVTRDALAEHLGLGGQGERRSLPFAALGRSGHSSTARDMEQLLEDEWADSARGR
ncbi:MAG: CopG family transcriptional regulator [Solirubrobacteraceae bacterium]